MVIVIFCILFLYLILVVAFYKGWISMPEYFVKTNDSEVFVSVIVCAHDEERSLPQLLQSLSCQTYRSFEIIVVNDHSTDATERILEDWHVRLPNLKVVCSQGRGKKSALAEGLEFCRGDVVLQTDADCRVLSTWVETVACYFSDQECDLLIGPVGMSYGNLWESVQALEFLSLVASGAGASGLNRPIMCNGANLAYKKALWKKVVRDQHAELLSGDDMFLLLAAKKQKAKISFLKSRSAIVWTDPCVTVRDFVRQRQRWSSKSGAYRDVEVIAVAICVMSVSLLPIVCLCMGSLPYFFLSVLAKTLIDIPFLKKSALFFSMSKLLWTIPFVEIVYPFYIVFCGISGWFRKRSW